MTTTYDHPGYGVMEAVPHDEYRTRAPGAPVPPQADWIAVTREGFRPVGFVADNRADAGGVPSPLAPEDEHVQPFEAYDSRGRFIATAHSLRGALAVIGNNS